MHKEEHQDLIDDCVNRQSKMTEWEVQFIDSISHKNNLTDKQLAKLESIWERITA